jgi:uncharacterized membrane protein YecN with MAPEG domain
MNMPITALFGGLLAPLYIVLALRVMIVRRAARIALGDGGDAALARRVRVHANFGEYAPLTLVLMGLAESLHAAHATLYSIGACLAAGRLLHAIGVSQAKEIFLIRTVAVALTFTAIIVAAIECVRLAIATGI